MNSEASTGEAFMRPTSEASKLNVPAGEAQNFSVPASEAIRVWDTSEALTTSEAKELPMPDEVPLQPVKQDCADEVETVSRIVRMPLALPDEQVWIALRRLAYQCAAFGNALLSESYIKARGFELGRTDNVYKDFNQVLSAAVRDAVGRECVGIWRRLGKKILRGEQTLARFSADRALVVRDRGVKLLRAETGVIIVRLRISPKEVDREALDLPVYMPFLNRSQPYMAPLIERLLSGEWPITKCTIKFERPGRKIFAFITYGKPVEKVEPGSAKAKIALDTDADQLWLRCDNGHRLSLTDWMHLLTSRKADFAGLHWRLRKCLMRRRRKGARYQFRRALVKHGSFESWSTGPLHRMSDEIVKWCAERSVGSLEWALPVDGLLPWAGLRDLCEYKGAERGITVFQAGKKKPVETAAANGTVNQ